jgi:hypothetical protein
VHAPNPYASIKFSAHAPRLRRPLVELRRCMRNLFAKLMLSAILAFTPWFGAQACECIARDVAKTYKDSTHVILGEVVKVDLVTAGQDNGGRLEYVATLKPVKTYKGQPNVEVRVRFFVNRDIISSCDATMRPGERYVILEKEREPLIYDSWCGVRIRQANAYLLDQVQALP